MATLEIRQCKLADLIDSPDFVRLTNEYSKESGRAITGDANPQLDFYRAQEASGSMAFAGAWVDGDLVGMMVIAFTVVPHFGVTVATTETLFVSSEHRKTGAGRELLGLADAVAVEHGCAGVLVSAPVGGVLSKVLPRSGFVCTNQLFFKAVK
jgi:GNAT superfamily N-acetyltransferase